MFFRRLYNWRVLMNTNIKHILIEIALIAIGVLLATSVSSIIEKQQEQSYIRTNLALAVVNLKENNRINEIYMKAHKNQLRNYRALQKRIRLRDDSWLDDKDQLILLSTTLSLSNANVGINNIINNNINGISDAELRIQLIDYLDFMGHNITDLDNFNTSIDLYSNLMSKHCEDVNYSNVSFKSIVNLDDFYADHEMQNQLDRVLFDREIYIDIIEHGIMSKSNELIDNINEYLGEN